MRINGEEIPITDGISLTALLNQQGYDIKKVAVEKNGDIVPKAVFDTTLLCNEDTVEVVRFVGGG